MQVLESGQMGVVRLRQALQRRVTDATASSTTPSPGAGACSRQRLVQTSDLTEGLKGAGLTPLSAFDAQKVKQGYRSQEKTIDTCFMACFAVHGRWLIVLARVENTFCCPYVHIA